MKRNAVFYMANLGSEFLRFFTWNGKGDHNNAKASALRCLKIINDLLIIEKRPGAVTEIDILQDILKDFLENNFKNYVITKRDLENYFNPFALKAMGALE